MCLIKKAVLRYPQHGGSPHKCAASLLEYLTQPLTRLLLLHLVLGWHYSLQGCDLTPDRIPQFASWARLVQSPEPVRTPVPAERRPVRILSQGVHKKDLIKIEGNVSVLLYHCYCAPAQRASSRVGLPRGWVAGLGTWVGVKWLVFAQVWVCPVGIGHGWV